MPNNSNKLKDTLQAPFPFFGGKRRVAREVWERFGKVKTYAEPFFGSGAVLLGRPLPWDGSETVTDKDGFITNFWRAVQADPEQVAHYADWPVSEPDLHARHAWLVEQRKTFVPRLEGDPVFFDPKIAGWWCWGICCWIGGQFCSGQGPWQVVKGQLVHSGDPGPGIYRQRIHLGNPGRGVNRPFLHRDNSGLLVWMEALANRLRLVRVCCGDFSRILSPAVTVEQGMTGVFLDPPYTLNAKRNPDLYRVEDLNIGHRAATWAFEHGDNPLLRIALCGYEGEYEIPNLWTKYEWKAGDSYGNSQASPENRHKERIWFSPACLASAEPLDLFRD